MAARRETASKLIEGGMSQREAAKALGVDPATVRSDLGLRENPSKSEGKSLTTKAERRAERELELANKQTTLPKLRYGVYASPEASGLI